MEIVTKTSFARNVYVYGDHFRSLVTHVGKYFENVSPKKWCYSEVLLFVIQKHVLNNNG